MKMIAEEIKEVLKNCATKFTQFKKTYNSEELFKVLKVILVAVAESLTLITFYDLPFMRWLLTIFHYGVPFYFFTFGR